MGIKTVRRPGYMTRAVIAWIIFNTILLFTLAVAVYIVKPYLHEWFVMIPLLVGVVVSEWIIMGETIAPIIKDWIQQEETILDDEQPSWEKK